MSHKETDAVRLRYERRKIAVESNRYSMLNASVWQSAHERQRTMFRLFNKIGFVTINDLKLVEVGCGDGDNLLEFLRIGFQPENLIGIELIESRVAQANMVLPPGIVRAGDAAEAEIPPASQDIVYQSVVFSSLLDDAFQRDLAKAMWSWVKPGGGVLWYDFIYNNPKNPDVRGVPVKRVRELFHQGCLSVFRVTLAPPVSRMLCRIHPALYRVFNIFPFLRTHVLCWIRKPVL